MKKTQLVLFAASILLAGCGGSDSGGGTPAASSNTAAVTSTPTPAVTSNPLNNLEDTLIPSGFNWKMQNTTVIHFKHISNISQMDGVALNIAGKHYVEIYSIDENNNTSATPFLKTMTTSKGEVEVLLTLLNSWKGITVISHLDNLLCINTLSKEQISVIQTLGCDVVIESESL